MKRIEFYNHPNVGRTNKPTDAKYMLLSDYISDRNDIGTIDRILTELKTVQSGDKTFEQVFTDVYGIISVGYNEGEFECDKDKAYFISNNPDITPSLEIPLQELIDLLTEWKAFMS